MYIGWTGGVAGRGKMHANNEEIGEDGLVWLVNCLTLHGSRKYPDRNIKFDYVQTVAGCLLYQRSRQRRRPAGNLATQLVLWQEPDLALTVMAGLDSVQTKYSSPHQSILYEYGEWYWCQKVNYIYFCVNRPEKHGYTFYISQLEYSYKSSQAAFRRLR